MQWENSGFVGIGPFCSLAQQSFLCIKHLKTEVLNNIFIFPLEIVFIFLFYLRTTVLAFLLNSDVLSLITTIPLA